MAGLTHQDSKDSLQEPYDEEAVRDFLTEELGEIPLNYRYAEGIHEVRKRLILRYGDMNFAKAMNTFQGLLESDDIGAGLGDDADLWRSWRHDHKTRREDFANPGTPRFPGIILPAAAKKARKDASIPITISTQGQQVNGGDLNRRLHTTIVNHSNLSRRTDTSKELPALPMQPKSISRSGINALSEKTSETSGPQKQSFEKKALKSGLHKITPLKISGLFAKDKGQGILSTGRERGHSCSKNDLADPDDPPQSPFSCDGTDEFFGDKDRVSNCSREIIIGYEDTLQPLPLKVYKGPNGESSQFPPHQSSAPSSQDRSSGYTTRYSTATSSANHSTPSTRDGFRNVARDLLSLNSAGSSYPSMLGNFSPLTPAKYNPAAESASSRETSEPYTQYATVTNANPFADDHSGGRSSLSDKQAHLLNYVPYISPNKAKGLGQSRSEGNVAFNAPSPIKTGVRSGSTVHFEEADESPVRGRQPDASRYLDELQEEALMDVPRSPSRRSRSPMKKMFGENGWLNRSTSMKEIPVEHHRKVGLKQWGEKIKQRVEGITEDVSRMLPNSFNPESPPKASVDIAPTRSPISLDPPTQARLYSEIELMICVTANMYLMQQRKEGRMSVESLLKVAEIWRSKGRPQVVEFQFDQATQRDLVLYNLKSFRFHGEHAGNRVVINSMMYNWKVLSKEMSIRTFCMPDSVVRKHLHDIYKILEMLGAPVSTFLAFQDIQLRTLNLMREEQKRREEKSRSQHGVERAWHPPPPVPVVPRAMSSSSRLGMRVSDEEEEGCLFQ